MNCITIRQTSRPAPQLIFGVYVMLIQDSLVMLVEGHKPAQAEDDIDPSIDASVSATCSGSD